MTVEIIDPLNDKLRALRTIQSPYHITPNEDGDGYRVGSGAFKAGSDGTISVDLEESFVRAGLAIDAQYPHPDLAQCVALVSNTVAEYQLFDVGISHAPVPGNDHHGSAVPPKANSAARRAARKLTDSCKFVVGINPREAMEFGAPAITLPVEPDASA